MKLDLGEMMDKRTLRIISVLIILISLISIYIINHPQVEEEKDSEKINVIVSVLPEAEFVERVGGEKVKVTVMVPPGADPHIYEPLPSQLKEVSLANIYAQVGSGIEFELAWMDKIKDMNRDMLIVNCSQGIELIKPEEENENNDPHVWVSPKNAKIMVKNIYDGLIQIDPGNKEYYRENEEKYLEELDSLDKNITKALSGKENRKIMVYHPAWGYLCKDYNLEQISIEKKGKEPTPQGVASIIDEAKKYNIKIIFVSPQFPTKSAEVIAKQIGGQIVFIDDLAKDYVENLNKVVDAINKAY